MSSSLSSDILCPNNGDVIWTSVKLQNGVESRYLTNFTELLPIGSGGFGVVAECENKLDKKVYAVKKISLKAANMPFQKILREVKAISSMSHPNIVRYYQSWIEPLVSGCTNDFWELDEIESPCLYIVIEYCYGRLSSFLDDFINHYSRELTLLIFRQVVQALAHIHEKNIIHRDLSRSNIFLDENGNAKVGDFGSAKELDDEGHAVVSTSDGMNRAPEYVYGEVDAKADIYRLGVILAELLYPFATGFERIQVLGG